MWHYGDAATQSLASGWVNSATGWNDTVSSYALLVDGTNVLAVEVHQIDASSSDISFDLSLTAATFTGACAGPDIRFAVIGDYGQAGQSLADVAARHAHLFIARGGGHIPGKYLCDLQGEDQDRY